MEAATAEQTTDRAVAAGIDGCRGGWVTALAFGSLAQPSRTGLRRFDDIRDVLQWHDAQCEKPPVAIDVPIGLPDRVAFRACDEAARKRLGRRSSCVFRAPYRELLGLSVKEAGEIVLERRRATPDRTFHKLTIQGACISDKIAEVDRALLEDTSRQQWLIEVHPEVSFRELAGELAGADLPQKKTKAGKQRRRRLLSEPFPDIEQQLDDATWRHGEGETWLRRNVAVDDQLDAYAALWSALRFARDENCCLGNGERDGHDLLMRMVV